MEWLALVLLIAAAIWGIVFLRFAGLYGTIIATLLVGTVFGFPFFHVSLLTLDRAGLGACLFLYVIYRVWGFAEPKGWNRNDTIFAMFMIGMIGTTLLNLGRDIQGASSAKLLWYFLIPGLMYWLGRQVKLDATRLRWMYGCFAFLGLYLALTSVAERFELHSLVFPKYILDPSYEEFLGRGRGPLLNPSGNGILLTLGMSCAMVFLQRSTFQRLTLCASLPIYMLGIFCTMTRCVWMGAIAAFFAITFALLPKSWRAAFVVSILFVGGTFVAMKSENLTGFKRDKNVSVEDMKQSAQLRPILAAIAWKMFQDRPLTGCGTGLYLQHAKDYLASRDVDLPLEKARPYVQHNIFLAILVENGLMALVPFVLLWIVWLRSTWRVWNSRGLPIEARQLALVFGGFLSGHFFNGMFQDVLIVPMINMYLFYLAGTMRNVESPEFLARQVKERSALSMDRRGSSLDLETPSRESLPAYARDYSHPMSGAPL